MLTILKSSLPLVLIFVNPFLLFPQDIFSLYNKDIKLFTFTEYAKKINRALDSLNVPKKGRYKLWKRAEWWASMHLDQNGQIADYTRLNMEAMANLHRDEKADHLRSNSGDWYNLGYTGLDNGGNEPRQGRVNCIAIHPQDNQTIYAGTAGGGLWKTSDNGITWNDISPYLPNLSISGIALNSTGSDVYIITGDGFNGYSYFDYPHHGLGIFKSTNSGATWKQVYQTSPETVFGGYKIKVKPNDDSKIFAATSHGMLYSGNYGNTWTNIIPGFAITDFEFKPDNYNIIYYTKRSNNQIYKLDLSTFLETSTTLNVLHSVTRIELEVCPSSPNSIYAFAGPGFSSTWPGTPNDSARYNGTFFSGDAGASFALRNNNLGIFGPIDQSWYDMVIKVNPNNVNEILIGGVPLFKSTDGGVNFTYLNSSNDLHADCHALEQSPNGTLFLGNDGGVQKSIDFGSNWTNSTGQIVNSEVYRLAISQNADLLICGTQDNGQMIRNANSNIFHGGILGLDGMENIIDHSNNNVMYACTQNGALFKSINGGNSFTPTNAPANGGPWITGIVQSPSSSNTLFYGSVLGVFRSSDGSNTWTNIGGLNNSNILVMGSSNGSDILYSCNGASIYRTDNPYASNPQWINISNTGSYTSALAVNPANKDEIWAVCPGYTFGNKVFKSLNRGDSWVNLTLSLPNVPFYSIAFANNSNNPEGAVFVGSEIGVFYTDNNTPNWEPFYNALPIVPVTDIAVNYGNGEVTVATYGKGIWRSDGHNPCVNYLFLTGAASGKKFFQTYDLIETNRELDGNSGIELKLRAGNKIILQPGFKAFEGSIMKAVIGSCGSGVP